MKLVSLFPQRHLIIRNLSAKYCPIAKKCTFRRNSSDPFPVPSVHVSRESNELLVNSPPFIILKILKYLTIAIALDFLCKSGELAKEFTKKKRKMHRIL